MLREDAASEAVNNWVNDVVEKGIDCFDEEVAKRTIQSSLRQASRKRSVEPIDVKEDGFHGYKVIQNG